jgi:hypothetical protein
VRSTIRRRRGRGGSLAKRARGAQRPRNRPLRHSSGAKPDESAEVVSRIGDSLANL